MRRFCQRQSKKTILAKELINSGEVRTVNEAVVKANLSRSAYYKYKDYVYSFFEATRDKIVTLSMLLRHRRGTLQAVLQVIAEEGGNVMTIDQGLPARGAATVNISLETAKTAQRFADAAGKGGCGRRCGKTRGHWTRLEEI